MNPKESLQLTHVDSLGRARMVDVSDKAPTRRTAVAEGRVKVAPATLEVIRGSSLPKGNPFEVARIAGIQAAKETSRLIPLCHGLQLDFVDVAIELVQDGFRIRSEVRCREATGVEMEALTAVSVTALTLYDMCKAVDKGIEITSIRLLEKRKGSSATAGK